MKKAVQDIKLEVNIPAKALSRAPSQTSASHFRNEQARAVFYDH